MTAVDAPVTEAAPESGTAIEVAPEPAAPVLGDLATVPEDHELRTLVQLANTFSTSSLVPKPLQNKPADCLLVMMTARDLGLSLTVAFRECHPIDGRVTASPKLRLAIVRSRGLGKVWPDPSNDGHAATWHAVRADAPDITYTSTVTWEEAQDAGLAGIECRPGNHKRRQQNGKTRCGCKDNWAKWGPRMLNARALGFLMDDAFGEVGTGLYDADSLGVITDADGRPVLDVHEVGSLDGMPEPRGARRSEGPGPANPDELAELRRRIQALPSAAVTVLAERWTAPKGEGGTETFLPTHDGKPATGLLDARTIRSAAALVKAIERESEAGKYGDPLTADGPPDVATMPIADVESELSSLGEAWPTDTPESELRALLAEVRANPQGSM